MRKIITITTLIAASMLSAFAQTPAEQEILQIHAGLDQAFIKKDMAYFEGVLAPDYVYSDPQGKMFDRAGNLEQLKTEWANANYKMLSAGTESPKVKIMGNTALITADWTFVSQGLAPEAEPHHDRGRYTGVYEKRDGKWLLIAEHFSEAAHDRKLMEQQVMKAGQSYGTLHKNRDKAGFERLFADEYMYTNESGLTRNKAEDIAHMTSPDMVIESTEISDQKVRVIGNGAAVETGTYKAKGSNKGKAFEESGRYTTTWVWRGGRWQIVADHTSAIK
jgi:hypothetical protein